MFLNVQGDVPAGSWNHNQVRLLTTSANESQTECSLMLGENPMTDFVELPENQTELQYSNLLCGVFRGALEMVSLVWLANSATGVI